MGSVKYVPILKGKEGEYAALAEIPAELRESMVPLIEVPAIPYDFSNDRPSKSLDAHLAAVPLKLRDAWQAPHAGIMLALDLVGEEERTDNGLNAYEYLLPELIKASVSVIPVVRTGMGAAARAAVAKHNQSTKTGVAVRLFLGDFDEDGDIDSVLEALLKDLHVSPVDVDIIIDLDTLSGEVSRDLMLARSAVNYVPRIQEWRRLVVAAASFPDDLSEVDASTSTRLLRHEWTLWGALRRKPERLSRSDLVFADYGISSPRTKELDPRTMRMSASIRYTTTSGWLVVKGRNVRQHGFEQYYTLAAELVRQPEFCGDRFSWGDSYIAQSASRSVGTGNATTWRKVGTNHHLVLVATALQS